MILLEKSIGTGDIAYIKELKKHFYKMKEHVGMLKPKKHANKVGMVVIKNFNQTTSI